MRKHLFVAAVLVFALASGPPSQAQVAPDRFEYVVKFVCGKSDDRAMVVAPGVYYTAINVRNPNERGFGFRKKFAIALPGERAGRVTKFVETKLGPDEAFEIDCPDILRHLDAGGFVKGFVVIGSRLELDVVAVYTAAGRAGTVETIDVEHVKPRRREDGGGGGQPDLIPVPDPVTASFCRIKDGKLVVTIRNQGTGNAAASMTRVDFSTGASPTQATPAIPAGGQVDVLFDIPPGCFQPDCHFRITADSGFVVPESNEANNTASGSCIG